MLCQGGVGQERTGLEQGREIMQEVAWQGESMTYDRVRTGQVRGEGQGQDMSGTGQDLGQVQYMGRTGQFRTGPGQGRTGQGQDRKGQEQIGKDRGRAEQGRVTQG